MDAIAKAELQHEKHPYYESLGLQTLFRKLRAVADETRFSATLEQNPEYGYVLNRIYVSKNMSTDDFIHEGVHAIDDIEDINFCPSAYFTDYYGNGLSSVSRSEGMAYVTMSLIGSKFSLATQLAIFERDVLDPHVSDFELRRDWLIIWDLFKLSKIKVFVHDQGSRKANEGDLKQVKESLGISLDWRKLAEVYMRFAREKGHRDLVLPQPSDAVLKEYQDAYNREKERLYQERIKRDRCK